VELARRGLGALGQQVSVDRCRLLAATGSHLSLSGDYETGAPLLTEALAMAEELGDRHLLGLVLLSKGLVHYWHMQMWEAVESGLRAAELLRSVGSLWSLAEALWFTRNALLSLGRYEEAARMAVEAEPLAERLGHLFALVLIRRASGCGDLMLTGDIDRFEEFAKADLDLARSTGMPWISDSYTWLGGVHLWRGEWGQALESHQEGVKLEPPGPLAGFAWALLFLCRAYVGDGDSALAMLDDRMSSLPRPGRAHTLGAWSMLFAAVEGLAVLGEREKAAKLYPLVLEAFDTGCPTRGAIYGLLQTVAGMAAAAGGQWEKAEEHYQTALRQAHELPVVIEQPEVRRWYARMLIDRDAPGDREKARGLLTEAVAMYRRIGMPKHVEMAEALLSRL
jgi:tetratricopeptide (TPR) repeat protein